MQPMPLGSSSVRHWLHGSLPAQNIDIALFARLPVLLLSIYSKVMHVFYSANSHSLTRCLDCESIPQNR